MQFTAQEQHVETLELLMEVRDHIVRWPINTINRSMINRINDHLAHPARSLVQKASYPRSAICNDAVGREIFRATLVEHVLSINVPPEGKGADDALILGHLRGGIRIFLESDLRLATENKLPSV